MSTDKTDGLPGDRQMVSPTLRPGAEEQPARLTPFDAVARAMDKASLLAGAVAANDRDKADAYAQQLRRHLIEYMYPREAQPVALPPAILKVIENLHTQDNRITENPLFAVQQKRRVYGLDENYADAFGWSHPDRDSLVTQGDAEFAALEEEHDLGNDPKGEWTRVGYRDLWEFVTGCLTEQGCKDYIAANGHNLHEPRIYAYGSYRNAEFIALRKWLMSLAAAPSTPQPQGPKA